MDKSLFSLVMLAGVLLVGCGEQPSDDQAKPAAPAAAPAAAEAEAAPVAPGTTGLIPAPSDEFIVATDEQRQALQSAGGSPCAVDRLNSSGTNQGAIEVARSQNLDVIGWVLNPGKEAPREFALALVGESSTYLGKGTSGRSRPDVARVHGAASATPSGYRFTAPLGNVRAGEYDVVLVQDTHDTLTQCQAGWKIVVTESTES